MNELYELNPHKMTTPQEEAQCVSWFIETKSNVQTQRNYRSKYGRDPPSRPSICLWHKKFMETGTVFDTRRSGRPRTFEKNIKRVRQAFQRSPMKSIRTAARQLKLPRSQSPTQEFKIVCLQSANVTGISAKACLTRLMFFSNVLGRPLLLVLNTVPVSINFLCHKQIEGRDDGSLPYLLL